MCICAETMILSRNGFTGSVTNACRIEPVIGSGTPASAATGVDQPAVALRTTLHEMSPWFVERPRSSVPDVEARDLDALVDLDAAPAGLLGVAPDDRVVADDAAGRVVERPLDRPRHVLADVDLRAELLHLVAVDHAAVDPEQLVDLGALVLHDERAVRSAASVKCPCCENIMLKSRSADSFS